MLKITNICCLRITIVFSIIALVSTTTPASTALYEDGILEDSVFSQDTSKVDSLTLTEPVHEQLTSDTTLFIPTLRNSKARSVTNITNFEKHLTQSPTAALFKSMVVPGMGQIGNRRYLKAAIAIGLETYFFSKVLDLNKESSNARQAWQAETDLGLKRNLYNEFDEKRNNRNKFIWYTGITIFFSMFDAYVDAHLSGSPSDSRNDRIEESETISMNIVPELSSGIGLSLNLKF